MLKIAILRNWVIWRGYCTDTASTPSYITGKPKQLMDNYLLTQDGLSIYYREIWTGPSTYNKPCSNEHTTILCLPGLTRNHRDFLAMASQITDVYHLICPDMRGRGQSQYDSNPDNYSPPTYVKDMWLLLDELSIDRVVVLGTSLGGLMGMLMAAEHPDRIEAVILNDIGAEVSAEALQKITDYLNSSGPEDNWHSTVLTLQSKHGEQFTDLDESQWEDLAKRLYQVRNNRIVPDYDQTIIRNTSQNALDLWPIFKALLSIPALVLRGENSDLLTSDTLSKMKALKQDLHTATVPNRGHAPFLDEDAAINAIQSFLQGLRKHHKEEINPPKSCTPN